jgi:hypothetical protein
MENWGDHQFNNSLTLTNCMSQLSFWYQSKSKTATMQMMLQSLHEVTSLTSFAHPADPTIIP